MPEPKSETDRRMFLSYVTMAMAGDVVYATGHDPPIKDVKGYLYVERASGNLCLRVEHVYVEITPKLLKDAWKED